MSHHNYPNHGRFRQSPTGGDSGSSYSEQGHGRTILPPLTIAFPTSDSIVKTRLHSSSSSSSNTHTLHTLLILLTSSFPRQDTIVATVRRTSAPTTEPRLLLVQPTLGGLRL